MKRREAAANSEAAANREVKKVALHMKRCEYHRGHPCRLIWNAVTPPMVRGGAEVRRIAPPPPRFRRCFSLCGEGPERQDDHEEEGEASPICCICVPSAGEAVLWGSALLSPTYCACVLSLTSLFSAI
ncbi:unnamed protein product [Gadus morhua 'NCC']